MNEYNTITQMIKTLASKAILAGTVFLLAGCHSLGISSSPSGARVFLNDSDTGKITPASIRVRDLPLGFSYVTVAKDGYITSPPKQEVEVHLSVGNLVWSWFPPVLIKNLVGDMWKDIEYPSSGHLEDFILQPGLGAPSTTTSVQPEGPPASLPDPSKKKPITNADVVTMIKANLSETTIIAAIKQGPTDFDTSPTALIELKEQGVTDDMLQAMMHSQPQPNDQ